jgi:hypothetical protein
MPIYKHSKLQHMEITIGICPFTNTPSLPLCLCLSRSYRHMPIYKHSKLQRMEITTPLCLSRSYRHMPIYKHSKLQRMEITTPLCLSRSYRHMPIYKHSKLQHMEITTLCAFLGLIGICPFTNTPRGNYTHIGISLQTLQVTAHGNYHSTCLSRSYRHMPIYKHSKLQRMEITTLCAFLGLIGICPFTNTPSYNMEITTLCAFLGLIGICPFTNTPSYNAWKLPLRLPF